MSASEKRATLRSSASVEPSDGRKDIRRPGGVLNELPGSNRDAAEQATRQSFLSKLTRADAKGSGAREPQQAANGRRAEIESETGLARPSDCQAAQSTSPASKIELSAKEEEEDVFERARIAAGDNKVDTGASQARKRMAASSEGIASMGGDRCAQLADERCDLDGGGDDENDGTKESDQVIPSWPSRIEAIACKPELVQHKVYSLKDYSQVASPTVDSSSNRIQSSLTSSSSSGGKFLKSMSQDRKVKVGSKRMSECLYPADLGPSGQATVAKGSTATATTTTSKHQAQSGSSHSTSASFSMGPASSVNSLLPTSRHAALMGESRIDRMRKLFVSPLSLRSGGGKAAEHGGGHQASAAPPRLSFQSGASVLNKPHHLMHAVYRSGAAGHHNRRSPMRQKQANGFRVYGCPLQLANNIYPITCFGRADIYKQQSVPYVLARLCNYIEENSSQLTHEGIFRVSGNARLMEKLRTLFDHLGDAPLESESVDVATSASMLKMYLRELPEPLIPTRMNYYFITLAKKYSPFLSRENVSNYKLKVSSTTSVPELTAESLASNERQRSAFSRDLTKLLRKLPIENYNLLKYLSCFLYRISLKQQYNKMCAEALGIVFGPNVFRIRSESYKGLKEQELSNQIMASIISNYKYIFDSEITDPLGNLIESGEDLDVEGLLIGGMKGGKKGEFGPASQAAADSALKACKTSPKVSPIPLASTSSGPDSRLDLDGRPCCEQHCQGYAAPMDGQAVEQVENEEEGEEEEGEPLPGQIIELSDSEDGDCGEEEESYTPSSGSASYCSSMDSGTLESSYEDDGRYPPRRARKNLEDTRANVSSSECASDTSYTPTSSHTDSEQHDDDDEVEESVYGESSSYESSPSFGKLIESGAGAGEGRRCGRLENQESCLVCERRESSAAARLAGKTSEISKLCDTRKRTGSNQDLEGDDAQVKQIELASHLAEEEPGQANSPKRDEGTGVKTSTLSNNKLPLPSRLSRKRRLEHGQRTPMPVNLDETDSTQASPSTKVRAGNKANVKTRASDSCNKGRHSSRTPSHKFEFLERRSSSASSLSRMKHRRDQIAAAQRRIQRDELHQRVKTFTDRRRPHFQGNQCSYSTRRTRNPYYSGQNLGSASGATVVSEPAQANTHYSPVEVAKDVGLLAELVKSEGCLEKDTFSPLHLAGQAIKEPELDLDYLSAQYRLEELECDKCFVLRPFSSDETLLKSVNYCTEFANQTNTEQQRRFSGHDFGDKVNLVQICRPCDKIFEGCEGDVMLGLLESNAPRFQSIDFNRLPTSGERLIDPNFETSFVSLIDNRLTGFRKSGLSIDEVPNNQDSILTQIKATKELIKALRRLLKHGSSNGYTREMEQLVVRLTDEPNVPSNSDDCCTCFVDYLSAKSLTKQINRILECVEKVEEPSKVERLNSLLSVKISLFKQRHNDLKNIREHYMKNHINQTATTQKDTNSRVKLPRMRNPSKTHGSLDTLKLTKAAERTLPRGRKMSAPNNQVFLDSNSEIRAKLEEPENLGKILHKDLCPYRVTESQLECPREQVISSSSRSTEGKGSSSEKQVRCKFGSLCPVEFVFNIEKQLSSKRIQGSRVTKLGDMTYEQLQCEKLELQKNLLRYEHWFGRPMTRLEFSLVGHLYERYRTVKALKQLRQQQLAAE